MARSSVSRLERKGVGPHRMTWGVRIIPPRTKAALLSGASASVLAAGLTANPGPGFAAECDPIISDDATSVSGQIGARVPF